MLYHVHEILQVLKNLWSTIHCVVIPFLKQMLKAPPTWIAGLTGVLAGLVMAPISAALLRKYERKRLRRILYDDIALAYLAISEAVDEVSKIWKAYANSIIGMEGFFSFLNKGQEKESNEDRRARKTAEADEMKKQVIPLIKAKLKEISTMRYDKCLLTMPLLLFELQEYPAVERVFDTLSSLQKGAIAEEDIYRDIGLFRSAFVQFDQQILKRALKRMGEGPALNRALNNLKREQATKYLWIHSPWREWLRAGYESVRTRLGF